MRDLSRVRRIYLIVNSVEYNLIIPEKEMRMCQKFDVRFKIARSRLQRCFALYRFEASSFGCGQIHEMSK